MSTETAFGLDEFDTGFAPAEGSRPNELASLPDGTYDFEIADSELIRTKDKGVRIWKMSVRVLTPGSYQGLTVERAAFPKDKESVAYIGKDCLTLGFDSDMWNPKNERKFSVEFPKAIAIMKGLRFEGKKVSNTSTSNGKLYHNLWINKRIEDGKPARFGPKELNAINADSPF